MFDARGKMDEEEEEEREQEEEEEREEFIPSEFRPWTL